MIAQTSEVTMDTEYGNLMEITMFDEKTVAQAIPWNICINRNVITVYVSFPWKTADKQMPMCDLSSDAPDPAQSSGLIHQCGNTKNLKWVYYSSELPMPVS